MLTLAKEYEERTINNQERELLKKILGKLLLYYLS